MLAVLVRAPAWRACSSEILCLPTRASDFPSLKTSHFSADVVARAPHICDVHARRDASAWLSDPGAGREPSGPVLAQCCTAGQPCCGAIGRQPCDPCRLRGRLRCGIGVVWKGEMHACMHVGALTRRTLHPCMHCQCPMQLPGERCFAEASDALRRTGAVHCCVGAQRGVADLPGSSVALRQPHEQPQQRVGPRVA
eukprot:364373-Chlamydomonas_euryale.AAC.2